LDRILYGFLNEIFGPLFWVLFLVPAALCAVGLLTYIVVKVIYEIRK